MSNLDLVAIATSAVDPKYLKIVRDVLSDAELARIHDATFHQYRYALSLQYLDQNFFNHNLEVLELGEPGPFTRMLMMIFPNWNIVHQNEDLREGLYFESCRFDLVISTEVLEHIADVTIRHEITSQGVKSHLKEVYRVLKQDGCMFLTTPNASSIWCIKRILMQEPPLIYENHYREFSHNELRALTLEAGFEIDWHESKIAWNFWDFTDIEKFMTSHNYDLSNRGDDQFMLARKNT